MPIAKCLFDTTLYTKVLHLAVGTFFFRSQYFAWNAVSVASPTWPIPVTRNHLIFSRYAAGLCSLWALGAPGWFQWPGITLSRQCPWLASWHLWHLALGWYQQTDPTTLGWQRPWSVSLRPQLSTSDSPLSPPSVACALPGGHCALPGAKTPRGTRTLTTTGGHKEQWELTFDRNLFQFQAQRELESETRKEAAGDLLTKTFQDSFQPSDTFENLHNPRRHFTFYWL